MKFVRTHRALVACTLTGLVLFSALLCSLGHGRMLAAFVPAAAQDFCGEPAAMATIATQQAGIAHPAPDGHGLIMQLALLDCAFAGKLGPAVLALAVLAWWLRRRPLRLSLHERLDRPPSRHTSPGRVAQAP